MTGSKLTVFCLVGCIVLSAFPLYCGYAEYDRDRDGIRDQIDLDVFKAEDRDGFEDEDGLPEPGAAEVSGSGGEVGGAASVTDTLGLMDIVFPPGETSISGRYLPGLNNVGELLTLDESLEVILQVLPSGENDDTRTLAAKRVRAVEGYLRLMYDIKGSRMTRSAYRGGPVGGGGVRVVLVRSSTGPVQ